MQEQQQQKQQQQDNGQGDETLLFDGPTNRLPEMENEAAPDPFDPMALRLSQDFAADIGVRRVITKIPCRKPHRHEFVRVKPGDAWKLETCLLEDKINRDNYLVARSMCQELAGDALPHCLFVAITRNGDLILWPVRLPGPDGRSNPWHESALAAADLAERKWIRITANMSGGMYDVYEASGQLPEPEWPALTLKQMLRLSFQSHFIETDDHPILRALRGEV